MAPSTGAEWIIWIALGGVLGGLGQTIRAAAGLKKLYDESGSGNASFAEKFEWPVFIVSLIIGFTAGALASLAVTFPDKIDAGFLITFVAAGYAGADFIEAFIKKHLPSAGANAPSGANPSREFSSALKRNQEALMAMSTERAVIQVIADVKHLNPGNIEISDKLSELQFSLMDRRNLANEINIFFQHTLHLVFDTLMHPSETADDQTVGEVIDKVKAKHPRPGAPA